ncbi:MAG: hypothetical protein LH603_21920 [Pseudonocardia sp.]|nr:hypothetical protein [Pseudonocardia sp.]
MRLPASFSLLAVRMWWPVVVALVVLGMGAGLVSTRAAQYSATTYVRVDVSTNPVQSVQIVSSALQLVDSDPVYARVVGESRAALNGLRARTTVGIRDAGAVLFVTVVAPTPEQAERDADEFGRQAVEHTASLAREQFTAITELGGQAIEEGALPDPAAEAGRRARLGEDIADGQNSALRSANLVTRIGGVQTPVRLGVSPALAAPLGGLVGGLAGLALALGLGVRRRSVRSVSDLRSINPRVRVYGADNQSDGLLRVVARCATLDHPVVAVLALPGAERHLAQVVADLRDRLRAEGMRWKAVDADDLVKAAARAPAPGDTAVTTLSLRRHPHEHDSHDLTLVTGVADGAAVAQVSAVADLAVLVGRMGVSKLGELAALCAELEDNAPLVVLGPRDGPPPAVRGGTVPGPAAAVAPEAARPVAERWDAMHRSSNGTSAPGATGAPDARPVRRPTSPPDVVPVRDVRPRAAAVEHVHALADRNRPSPVPRPRTNGRPASPPAGPAAAVVPAAATAPTATVPTAIVPTVARPEPVVPQTAPTGASTGDATPGPAAPPPATERADAEPPTADTTSGTPVAGDPSQDGDVPHEMAAR